MRIDDTFRIEFKDGKSTSWKVSAVVTDLLRLEGFTVTPHPFRVYVGRHLVCESDDWGEK